MIEQNNLTPSAETEVSKLKEARRSIETIYYFHGYNGYLTNDKREVLQQFGKVIAPTFNYSSANTLSQIIDSFKEVDLQSAIFMGSSYGGYIINVLNEQFDIPGLLFNPALPYRILLEPGREQFFTTELKSLSHFVLGKKDKLVRYQDNLDYISKYIKGPKEVILDENLGHSIPVKSFEMYVSGFLEKVQKT
ncbi:MAG: YqiA/YcfP family alpha/beta fold hydrolase [Ginsengibacter sp.]